MEHQDNDDNNNRKATEAMIELMKTPYANTKEVEVIYQTLDETLSSMPKNATVAISLLQAEVMLGKTKEAVELAERIWNIGGVINKQTEALYIYLLNSLGMFNYAKVLLEPRLSLPKEERERLPNVASLLINCYAGIGDLKSLQKIATFEELGEDRQEILAAFCSQMIEDGAEEHFMWQQRKIHEVIKNKCAAYEVLLSLDEGYPELEIGVFAGGDSVDRYQLQKNIDKVYNDYYDIVDYVPLDNFLLTVYDIKEHWAYDGSMIDD